MDVACAPLKLGYGRISHDAEEDNNEYIEAYQQPGVSWALPGFGTLIVCRLVGSMGQRTQPSSMPQAETDGVDHKREGHQQTARSKGASGNATRAGGNNNGRQGRGKKVCHPYVIGPVQILAIMLLLLAIRTDLFLPRHTCNA